MKPIKRKSRQPVKGDMDIYLRTVVHDHWLAFVDTILWARFFNAHEDSNPAADGAQSFIIEPVDGVQTRQLADGDIVRLSTVNPGHYVCVDNHGALMLASPTVYNVVELQIDTVNQGVSVWESTQFRLTQVTNGPNCYLKKLDPTPEIPEPNSGQIVVAALFEDATVFCIRKLASGRKNRKPKASRPRNPPQGDRA